MVEGAGSVSPWLSLYCWSWESSNKGRSDALTPVRARAGFGMIRQTIYPWSKHCSEPVWKSCLSNLVLQGIFLASGPRLPIGQQINSVSAVDIYPMMLEILGLSIAGPIDGDPDALVGLLRE